jgi:hypothetical protein
MVVQTGVGLGEASGVGVRLGEASGVGVGLGLEIGEGEAEATALGMGVCVLSPIVADPQPAIRTQAASSPRYFMLPASPQRQTVNRVEGHSF